MNRIIQIDMDDIYLEGDKLKERLKGISKFEGEILINKIKEIEIKVRGGDIKNILWSAGDLAKESNTEDPICIVKYYLSNPPQNEKEILDDLDNKIKNGEETRIITTVKGSIPWLLQKIIAQFKNEEYPELIKITETLFKDESIYVRMQAITALSAFTQNLYAEKNKDSGEFYFYKNSNDKKRILDLSFKVLEDHKQYPRFLEYLVFAFVHLRRLDLNRALLVLNTFFYKANLVLQEDYVIDKFAPLAIYYAEFVTDVEPDFDTSKTKLFLINLIKNSTPRLESTLVWHIWKTIEEDDKTLVKLRQYIDILFLNKFNYESESQYLFLVEKVSNIGEDYAIELYERLLDKLIYGLEKDRIKNSGVILHYSENILKKISISRDINFLMNILVKVKKIKDFGCYVGHIEDFKNLDNNLKEDDKKYFADEMGKLFIE